MSERILPSNYEAEQSVLGAALHNEYAADEVSDTLKKEDFFYGQHAEIFETIAELSKAKISIDLVTVSEALKRRGKLEGIGGARYLAELVSAVPAPTNIRHYVGIVCEHATRRKLVLTSEKICQLALSGKDDANATLEFAEHEILEIGKSGQRNDYDYLSSVIDENLKELERLSKLGSGELTGLTTGFPALNRLTLGFQPSDLIILAARPSQGKTALALNIAANAALKAKAVVVIFSLEMSKHSLGLRLLSTQAEIDSKLIQNGQALKDSISAERIGNAAKLLAETKIIIDDNPSIKANEMRNKCRRVRNKEGRLDLIIVDYLQLMDVSGNIKLSSKPENRQQEISALTRALKQLARDMRCPVLVLSQLNREVDKRKNKKPFLADLRESGAIEQDADIVMFLYQEGDKDNGEGPDINHTKQLHVAKHRNGETGQITLRWLEQYTKFAHYDPEVNVF